MQVFHKKKKTHTQQNKTEIKIPRGLATARATAKHSVRFGGVNVKEQHLDPSARDTETHSNNKLLLRSY